MDLSALTNPTETDISATLPLASQYRESQATETEPETESRTESLAVSIDNGTAEMEQNLAEGSSKERTTNEYRRLYNYLLEKYRNATHTASVLDQLEAYLKNLSKYQSLRNNTLVNVLKFINDNESLKPVDPKDDTVDKKLLSSIESSDEKLKPFIEKLLKLETLQQENGISNSNAMKNIEAFNEIIGINDSLSSDLAILENNVFPDLYSGNFDLLELVKKNQCYVNESSSLIEHNRNIEREADETIKQIERDHTHQPRKRKPAATASINIPPTSGPISKENVSNGISPSVSHGDSAPSKRIKVEDILTH